MSVHAPTTPAFKANARAALADIDLQAALRGSRTGFTTKRAAARDALPEFDALRDRARDVKNHVFRHLDRYLEAYEAQVVASGGVVHWAETAEDARRIVLEICRKAGAKTVNKGKTMISEECGINDFLSENGIKPVETDLGEYIIQLRGEVPSPHHRPGGARHGAAGRGGVPQGAHPSAGRAQPQRALGAAARGARRAAGEVFRGGGRHHRGEHADRRDRAVGDRDQRGQRGPQPVAAEGACRDGLDREDRADAGGRGDDPAGAGALGDRAGDERLHHLLARAAAGGGSRRAGGIPRDPARQRAHGDARHRVRGDAALHPLRGVHEPLPGLPGGGRACLRLGLSRADGRGADAEPDRGGAGRAAAEREHVLRAVRGGLPDAHPAAEADAALARAGVREEAHAGGAALGARGLGLGGGAALGLSLDGAGGSLGLRAMAREGSVRWMPLAGGWTGERDLPAPRGGTFMDQWKKARR
jgi:hypothetical protein